MELRTNADDFRARSHAYAQAWKILERACEFPPSLEVFEHELALMRRQNPVATPEGMARRIGEAYHRVQGFFDDAG